MDCRFDLSHSPVFMTCNDLDAVAKPLRDRCTVIRQLCEKLYQKGIRSIRQHQRLLDSVMEDAYIKALEGGEPIVTADSAAWAVDKVAGGNPHRAEF